MSMCSLSINMFYESHQKPYLCLMFSVRKNKFMCLLCVLFVLMQPTGLISRLLRLEIFSELGLLEPPPPQRRQDKTKQNKSRINETTNTCWDLQMSKTALRTRRKIENCASIFRFSFSHFLINLLRQKFICILLKYTDLCVWQMCNYHLDKNLEYFHFPNKSLPLPNQLLPPSFSFPHNNLLSVR